MTNLAAKIRFRHPLVTGRKRVGILFASAMFAGACLAPVAASATEDGEGAAGKGADNSVDSVAPPSAGQASEPAAYEKHVLDEIESALANARHWLAARPPRPHTDARKPKAPAAWSLPGPLRWAMRNVSRFLTRADRAADKASGATLGPPLTWLGARIRAATTDQDRAREAVKKGQIVPLASILKTVRESVPGDVLKVALDQDVEGSWSYSITVLTPQGYYRNVNVDAGSNQITQIKGH
jgi:hypothetical protein